MYSVRGNAAYDWDILCRGCVVHKVGSESYAKFLCNLLNDGTALFAIKSRPQPDMEYFAYFSAMNGGGL